MEVVIIYLTNDLTAASRALSFGRAESERSKPSCRSNGPPPSNATYERLVIDLLSSDSFPLFYLEIKKRAIAVVPTGRLALAPKRMRRQREARHRVREDCEEGKADVRDECEAGEGGCSWIGRELA